MPNAAIAKALQPHEGSSETYVGPDSPHVPSSLQPHEGSSETVDVDGKVVHTHGFNPTRVRLKPSLKTSPTSAPLALQPHEGSSET